MDTSIFITDTNMILSDSDSSTSSASTADELNCQSSQQGQQDQVSSNQNYKNILVEQFVKPIKSHGFFDKEQNKVIEDGFELVLLRLSHLFFSSDGVINFPRLTKWMDQTNLESQELEEFFLNNPGVMDDSDFYSTDAGIAIRKAWYGFLSGREFFTYIHSTHQIAPTITNWFMWIKSFFPKITWDDNLSDHEKINLIYSMFSWQNVKFQAVYSTYCKLNGDIIHKSFVHNIIINSIELFILESSTIRKSHSPEEIYWTKTELTYA